MAVGGKKRSFACLEVGIFFILVFQSALDNRLHGRLSREETPAWP
jgi:hypothetical protein